METLNRFKEEIDVKANQTEISRLEAHF